jgi:spore germination cell wall hydrolase CwlJ-like protein
MSASRIGVTGACCSARFWLSAFSAALMPTSIGYQDMAALLAREHAQPWHWHLIISPVQAATFSYSRPIGSAIPQPLGFQNVNYDPRSLDAFSWKIDEPIHTRPTRQIEYPVVQRSHKADRLPASVAAPAPAAVPVQPRANPQAAPAAPVTPSMPQAERTAPAIPAMPQAEQTAPAKGEVANSAPPSPAPAVSAMEAHQEQQHQEEMALAPAASADAIAPAAPASPAAPAKPSPPQAESTPPQTKLATAADEDDAALADKPPEIPAPGEADYGPSPALGGMSFLDANAADDSSAIYFGGVMGSPSKLQSWAPGAEPILASPAAELAAQSVDSNIKLSALEGSDNDTGAGESVAGKDDASRLQTPAQRLGLEGGERAKAEKCLADVVYFEARGEVRKGQEAVAQVVMNRVFSGYYPHDVCGVVYQNAHRHLACQFTFACERRDLNRIDEPDMWEQAKAIAKDELDGKIWLAEVGHATHYHAYWVHPSWVHEMTRLFKLGVHTFYRPRNWGDGDDEPVWGKTSLDKTSLDKTSAAPAAPTESNGETPSAKPEAVKSEAVKPDEGKSDAKEPQAAASPAGART